MTNVTLSIDNKVYRMMKKYSEIKWSEFIRKMIMNRINELEMVEKSRNYEGILTMVASEEVLAKDWNNENDERWNEI